MPNTFLRSLMPSVGFPLPDDINMGILAFLQKGTEVHILKTKSFRNGVDYESNRNRIDGKFNDTEVSAARARNALDVVSKTDWGDIEVRLWWMRNETEMWSK